MLAHINGVENKTHSGRPDIRTFFGPSPIPSWFLTFELYHTCHAEMHHRVSSFTRQGHPEPMPSFISRKSSWHLVCPHARFSFPLTSCYRPSCDLFGKFVMVCSTGKDDTVFLSIDWSDLVPLAGVFNKFPSSFNLCNSLAIAGYLTMNLPGSSGMSTEVDVGKIQGTEEYQRLSDIAS